jgi:hypothetical protein
MATAYHEASHAVVVVGLYLGFRVHSATVMPNGDSYGRGSHIVNLRNPNFTESQTVKDRMTLNAIFSWPWPGSRVKRSNTGAPSGVTMQARITMMPLGRYTLPGGIVRKFSYFFPWLGIV